MNSAHQQTVTWLKTLAPTIENRDDAAATFEQQTGAAPTALITTPTFWGWAGADAVLLYLMP